MHDRDDDEPEVIAPTTSDEEEIRVAMESATYRLQRLYQRLSQDRDSWAATGGNLAQAVQELQKQIKNFTALDEAFRQRLAKFIREETKQAASAVTETITSAVRDATVKEAKAVTDKLSATVERSIQLIEAHNKAMAKDDKWTIAAFMVMVIIGGMVGGLTVDVIYSHRVETFLSQNPPQSAQVLQRSRGER